MSPSQNERPAPPEGRHVETLRTSQQEARSVLDQQLSTLSDLHDRAMRTVRFTLLALGAVLSAGVFPGGTAYANWLTIAGAVSLVVAILVGLVTYASSNPEVGPSTDYFDEVYTEPYSEAEWRTLLLAGYVEWIDGVEELNSTNGRLLALCQTFLGVGVSLLAAGVLLALFGYADPVVSGVG